MQIKLILIFLLSIISVSQDNEAEVVLETQQPKKAKGLSVNEQIKNNELAKKHEIKLYKGIFQEHNFKIIKNVDFIISTEVEQEVMIVVDVLWKQKDIYLLAPIKKYEDISIQVSQLNKSPILKDNFYTATGFKFKTQKKSTYKIVFSQRGKEEKMLVMKISERLKLSKKAAKKDPVKIYQNKLLYSISKLETTLAQIKKGQIMDKQIQSYVLYQSSAYSHFQLFQTVLIVFISCIQVMFISKLLKSDSII